MAIAKGTSICATCGAPINRRVLKGKRNSFCDLACQRRHRRVLIQKFDPGPRRPWTTSELDYLRDNYRIGNIEELAKALGRGFAATVAQITKMELYKQAAWWTPERDQFLRDNADKGWSWCARELGRPIGAIYNRVRRLGIQLKMLKASDLERLRELHSQGLVAREIGEQLGVTDECVRRWLAIWKLPMNKRDEAKRMASLEQSFVNRYGVRNVAQARKVRKRRMANASLSLGVASLMEQLSAKE